MPLYTFMIYESPVRQKSKGRGDVLWLKTVLTSGTLSDRVAARTLLIQESPVHNLSSVSSLLAVAAKKGKRESILATGNRYASIMCSKHFHFE